MSKAIEEHLEKVTVENLEEFKNEAFCYFASSNGKNGRFEIGVNAFGKYIVRHNGKITTYNDPKSAVNEYIELVYKSDV